MLLLLAGAQDSVGYRRRNVKDRRDRTDAPLLGHSKRRSTRRLLSARPARIGMQLAFPTGAEQLPTLSFRPRPASTTSATPTSPVPSTVPLPRRGALRLGPRASRILTRLQTRTLPLRQQGSRDEPRFRIGRPARVPDAVVDRRAARAFVWASDSVPICAEASLSGARARSPEQRSGGGSRLMPERSTISTVRPRLEAGRRGCPPRFSGL
jgi:hypothetical protein